MNEQTLESIYDPDNLIDETGEFINEQDGQYEYWDLDDGEKRLVLITTFRTEDAYAHFIDDVNNYEHIKHLYNSGQLKHINPGQQIVDEDEDGEKLTYFEEWNTH